MPGARLILNARYFHIAKPGEKISKNAFSSDRAAALIQYIATRESVIFNHDENYENILATVAQQNTIEDFINENAEIKETDEYKRYQEYKSAGNATRLITKSAEVTFGVDSSGTYHSYTPATKNQIERINEFVEAVPDIEKSPEYQDYVNNPTMENASEVLSHSAEIALTSGTVDEKTLSIMMNYIATRPGVVTSGEHGLFSDHEVDLEKAKTEISTHKGRIWSTVVSLRREDANVLGYDNQEVWKSTVMTQIDNIAKQADIPIKNLHWYAAVHNTTYHPHIHLIFYSDNPLKQGFMKEAQLENIKSGFTNEIFQNELYHIHEQRDEIALDIREQTNETLSKLDEHIVNIIDGEDFKNSFLELSDKIQNISGKHEYKYLPKEIKHDVDSILKTVINQPEIKELYEQFNNELAKIQGFYNEKDYSPIEIADWKGSHKLYPLKNMIVKAADNFNKEFISQLSEPSETPEQLSNNIIELPEITEKDSTVSATDEVENISDILGRLQQAGEVDFSEPEQFVDWVKDMETHAKYDELENKALSGDGNARFQLAQQHFYGSEICEKDLHKAQMWYGIAADQNQHAEASYNLGMMYHYGSIPDEQNDTLAHEYLKKAAHLFKLELKNSSVNSKFIEDIFSGKYDIDSINDKFDADYKMLLNGYVKAGWDISEIERESLETEPKPGSPACKKTIKNEYLLGRIFYDGIGVEQNFRTAYSFFKLANDSGHVHSGYFMGKMYYEGKGVEQDYTKALAYYSTASNNGDPYASYSLGMMHYKGVGTKIDIPKAVTEFTKAAEADNPFAKKTLADILMNGADGVPEDKTLAHKLYGEALKYWEEETVLSDNDQMSYRIGNMYLQGLGTEINPEKAFEHISIAAKSYPFAQYKLADMYENGQGTQIDLEKASEYYGKALAGFIKTNEENENPDPQLSYRIGSMYEKGKGTEINLEKAFEYYLRSAEKGISYAQYKVGGMYENGRGTEINLPEAFKHYLASADTGNSYAQYKIGKMYRDGIGTEVNTRESFSYFLDSANNDNPFAQYVIGKILDEGLGTRVDEVLAQKYYKSALEGFIKMNEESETPNPQLSYRIGSMLENGKGTAINLPEAFKYYLSSADNGNAYAQYKVGVFLEEGKSVPIDKVKAQEYYNKALNGFIKTNSESQKPNPQLSYRIASMLENGKGTEINLPEAFKYYLSSADNGNAYAQYKVGTMYEKGNGTEINLPKAFKYYLSSADNGNAYAQYKVGYMFEKGKGVLPNAQQANIYYSKALNTYLEQERTEHDPFRQYRIGTMFERGQGTVADQAEAEKWYTAAANGSEQAEKRLEQIKHAKTTAAMTVLSRLLSMTARNINNNTNAQRNARMGVDKRIRSQTSKKKQEQGMKESHEQTM